MNLPTLALLTDFGEQDGFVGILKSVLFTHLQQPVPVIDLCHHIAPQNIRHGAWVLQSALPYFPSKTVLIGVVDPDVGAQSQASLLVHHPKQQQLFLAPDNGLLTPLLEAGSDDLQIYHIQNFPFYKETAQKRSSTFHGRDVYAPVSAMAVNALLSNTLDTFLADFGKPVSSVVRLEATAPQRLQQGTQIVLEGSVAHIDTFGNVITNIPNDWVLMGSTGSVNIGSQTFTPIKTVETYSMAATNEVVIIPSSGNTAELAVKQGNAALVLQATVGQKVFFIFQ